jgi:hypothetical protein
VGCERNRDFTPIENCLTNRQSSQATFELMEDRDPL